jgi:hypothetical protein
MDARRNSIVLVVLVLMAAVVHGKGPTVRVVVSADGLPQPIEILDPRALVHVWSDDFVGAAANEPSPALPRYTLSFFAKPPRSDVRKVYVLRYVLDPGSGQGFIYFPNRSEAEWRLNASTILRERHDGRWFLAAAVWNDALRDAIR